MAKRYDPHHAGGLGSPAFADGEVCRLLFEGLADKLVSKPDENLVIYSSHHDRYGPNGTASIADSDRIYVTSGCLVMIDHREYYQRDRPLTVEEIRALGPDCDRYTSCYGVRLLDHPEFGPYSVRVGLLEQLSALEQLARVE